MCKVPGRRSAARLAHASSTGACRVRQKQPFGASSVDHLSRPDHLVGAEFAFGDAITPPRVALWRLPDVDRHNLPWCRHQRPSDHSACGVTADLVARLRADAASPGTAHAWQEAVGSGQAVDGRHGRERRLMHPIAHATTIRRDRDTPRPSARRHGRHAIDRRSALHRDPGCIGTRSSIRPTEIPNLLVDAPPDGRRVARTCHRAEAVEEAWFGGCVCPANEHVSAGRQTRAKS